MLGKIFHHTQSPSECLTRLLSHLILASPHSREVEAEFKGVCGWGRAGGRWRNRRDKRKETDHLSLPNNMNQFTERQVIKYASPLVECVVHQVK